MFLVLDAITIKRKRKQFHGEGCFCKLACIFIPRYVHEKGSKLCLLGFWRKLQKRLKVLEGKFFFFVSSFQLPGSC